MPEDDSARIAAVRGFNRFYTRQIGVLRERLLRSPFSLTEVRVLYELAHREKPTASLLGKQLGLDAGYLSRILRGFESRGLIGRTPSQADARQSHLSLTAKGRKTFAPLDARSDEEVRAMLSRLTASGQSRLLDAMRTIQGLLGARPESKSPYLLRPHRPGDIGWVVHRHGVLYNQEYGWDETFEALVAEIAAKFIRNFDSRRERCWIAEQEGDNVGCVFLVKQSREVAKLRLFLVEPKARGQGIGSRLVEECIRFARQVGYRKMTLWTQDVLHAARHIYQKAGFHLVHEEPNRLAGFDMVSQTWDLEL